MNGYAISGRAGSGKSTLCGLLTYELDLRDIPAERVSFGDALKAEVFEKYGVTKDDPGGRELLVEYGHLMRQLDPLYWVSQFADRASRLIAAGVFVVCDDVRFLSELGWCHAAGFATVRLEVPQVIAASRIPQPADPNSPGECELDPWGGWSFTFEDTTGSLDLRAVRDVLAHYVHRDIRVAGSVAA